MNSKRPSKPSLSPSKIVTYLACDHKYKWSYVDPRGRWFARAKSYYSFGTSLHSVLEKFHDGGDLTVTTEEEAVQALETSWVAAGYSSAEEMEDAMARGKEILAAYTASETARDKTSTTLCVERSLKMDFPRFKMLGRVDRIEEYPDGTLEIIDYKSGRESVTSQEVHDDIAMGIYQLMVREAWPGRPVKAAIIALRTGQVAQSWLKDAEIEEFRADIEALGNRIIDTDFTLERPVAKELCPACDFLELCLANDRFKAEYEAMTKLTEPHAY